MMDDKNENESVVFNVENVSWRGRGYRGQQAVDPSSESPSSTVSSVNETHLNRESWSPSEPATRTKQRRFE
jgi:hypothetical protein